MGEVNWCARGCRAGDTAGARDVALQGEEPVKLQRVLSRTQGQESLSVFLPKPREQGMEDRHADKGSVAGSGHC